MHRNRFFENVRTPGRSGSPATDITEPQLMFAGDDKPCVGFVAAKSGGGVPAGVVLRREP